MATMTRGLEARRQMAEARRLALVKLERAAGIFAQAMESGSRIAAWGAAEAWRQLGLRYQELGRDDDAQMAFERATAVTSGRVQLASSRS